MGRWRCRRRAPSPHDAVSVCARAAQAPFKCRGFLVKQPVHGHLLSSPRQRFFSMTDDAIEWFVDKRAFRTGGDCRGRLPLALARTEWEGDALVLVARTGERLVLRSSQLTDVSLREWEASLQAAIARLASGNPGPVRSASELEEQSLAMISRVLSELDDRLVEVLRAGDMRFVRSTWVLQSSVTRIRRRQELEGVEAQLRREGAAEEEIPLLSAEEAVELVRRCDRSAGALTYGWLSAGDPDPAGSRLAVVRQALMQNTHIVGFFWDYGSLYQVVSLFSFAALCHAAPLPFLICVPFPQHPPGGARTSKEEGAFKRALGVMADVYASAVGTTVLQLREIPHRPQQFDGALCLFGLKAGGQAIRAAFAAFGEISSLELDRSPAVVRFASHASALAVREARPWPELCDGVDTLYNERSYNGRRGDDGFEDDEGRGW